LKACNGYHRTSREPSRNISTCISGLHRQWTPPPTASLDSAPCTRSSVISGVNELLGRLVLFDSIVHVLAIVGLWSFGSSGISHFGSVVLRLYPWMSDRRERYLDWA
jgi:hypothetical protein